MIYFIIFSILLELVIVIGGIFYILKYLSKLKIPITSDKIQVNLVGGSGKVITSDTIRDGVKSAFQEMEYEKEQEKVFYQKNKSAGAVYSSIPKDSPVKNSGGNLVPYNLSDDDKRLVEMFYGEN